MDGYNEVGPFSTPDPSTKNSLFAEDKDTINKLERSLLRAERNNKFLAMAVVAGVLVGGFGVWKAETRYYMVERTPDNRTVIYLPSKEEIPVEETIQFELARFVRDSRSIYRDNRANLEMRWSALKMVQMSDDERKTIYNEQEKELKDLKDTREVMVTDIVITGRGGDHYSAEWVETHRDRRTGRQKSVRQVADVTAFYVGQDGENPGGIMFSKPITSIHSESVEIGNEIR